MYVSFAGVQLASRGASNATPNQQVCDLGIVLCPTHAALFIVHLRGPFRERCVRCFVLLTRYWGNRGVCVVCVALFC